MKFVNVRGRLLGGAAMGVACAVAMVGLPGEARADSVCTLNTATNPDTINCVDTAVTPNVTATATVSDGVTLTAVDGLNIVHAAPLSVVVSSGTIQTTGAGENAVFLDSSAGGALTYTSNGTARTTADNTTATVLVGTTVTANTGTVVASGNGSWGVYSVSTNGNNTTSGGTTTVTGTSAYGLVTYAQNGNNITNTGVVTATGSGSIGVQASTIGATCGTNTVNVTGNVAANTYGIQANGCAASTVNVQAARTVSTSATGGATIQNNATTVATTTVNGTVTAAAPNALAIDANGTSSVTTIASTGAVTGTFNGTGGADTFTINAGGAWTTAGTTDFGAGTDSLANAGTINLAGATTLTGLETLTNTGTINLNTFTLTGPAVAFTNAGTIDTSGSAGLAGFTALSNSGTLDLAAGTFTAPAGVFTNTGTIRADEGATTITGQSSFANSGTIDLEDGAVGDTLTINSAFVGSGNSNLLVDFTTTASDRLVITGAASGTTTINANFLGGGLINLDGVLVVDTASTSANAFVLGTVDGDTPLVDFSLVQSGSDFLLVSAPTAAAFDPLLVSGFSTSLWYQSADEVIAETRKPATTSGLSAWGNFYASRNKLGDEDTVTLDGTEFDVDNRLEIGRQGFQLGVDYGFGAGRIGLTGGLGRAKGDSDADFEEAGLKAKGWNIGAYGQFGGLTGFHGELLLKHDKYDAEFHQGVFEGAAFDIRSTGFDGGAGYRFGMGGATLDAIVGLSHVSTKADGVSAFGFDYDFATMKSTRGRAGLRAIFGGKLSPFIDGTVYREFDGDGDVALFDGGTTFDLDTEGKGTWLRLEGGLGGNDGPGPILAAWADIGDRDALGMRVGLRLGGRVAEAAPAAAAPLPPPPAPVATQTCADGTVIEATAVCPTPPPPPPASAGERG